MNTNFTPIWAAEPDYEKFIQKCKANGVSRIITTIPPKELADAKRPTPTAPIP